MKKGVFRQKERNVGPAVKITWLAAYLPIVNKIDSRDIRRRDHYQSLQEEDARGISSQERIKVVCASNYVADGDGSEDLKVRDGQLNKCASKDYQPCCA